MTINTEQKPVRPSRWAEFHRLTSVETDDCIPWPYGIGSNGYGLIYLHRRRLSVHRVACEMAHGSPVGDRNQAAHFCGNRVCINPRHLRWATRAENNADLVLMGRSMRGEKHPQAVLTAEQIHIIRRLAACGVQKRMIAAQFGVTASAIRRICNGKGWGWLESDTDEPHDVIERDFPNDTHVEVMEP